MMSSTTESTASTGATASPSTGKRLMITKMILENFKSYAGSQEIGPFHKRFSSIVGPNGSGKSNVIDALLFVFGKRAKQLRLNKVSELIHKSSNYPDLDYAKVSVYFQLIHDHEESEDDFDVIPGSEFVVSRTAFKSNQSKYTVDGRNSTYTEVGTLLRSYGIDLDNNRFLILQGEVEQIAMMKPKALTPHEEGLLEYLEDIIGSNRFVERIEESSKALEEVSEQRVEKVNRLKVAEKERDNLSGSKVEAEAFIEKEKDIRRKRNMLCQVMEKTAQDNIDDYTDRMEKVKGKLDYERNKMKENEERMTIVQSEYEKIKAAHASVATDLQNSTTEYDSFERKDVKLQEEMKHAKALIKKHQTAITKEAKKETDSIKEAEELQVQIEKYQNLVIDYEEKKAIEEKEVEKIMESLQDATKELRVSLEAAQMQLAAQEKDAASLQTEKDSVTTAMQLVLKRSENAAKTAAGIEEKLNNLQGERQVAEDEVKNIEGAGAKELKKQIKIASDAIEEFNREESKLQSELREATREAEVAKATLQAQEQRNNSTGKNSVVQKLLSAAKKGGPLSNVGIRGRLGDLASIEDKYDVAISTACGMLDHIVVDTAEAGQSCISYLREKNIGRASFIALDQMQEWHARMQRNVNIPSGASRLFDLISISDAALQAAFYMALRDTLVAPNLDEAVKISYQGDRAVWRVVTFDGNLIDTSGAMSGGGKETRSGGMKLASGGSTKGISSKTIIEDDISPSLVQQLERKVTELQQALSDCRKRKAEAEKHLCALQQQEKTKETELQKIKMALARFCEQEAQLSARLTDAQSESNLQADEQAELSKHQAELDRLEGEIATVAPNLRTLQADVSSLQRQIKSVGGPKLAKAQQKIDSLVSQLETFATNLSTKNVELVNAKKQSEKSAAAREKAELEVSKAEQKLADLVAEQKEMENDALVVVTAVEAAKEKMAVLEEQLSEASKEFNEIKALVAKVKSVEVDLNVEVERIAEELKQAKATAVRWHNEGENIRKQHVEEQREFLSVVNSTIGPSNVSKTEKKVESNAEEDDAVNMSIDQSPQKESSTSPLVDEDGIESLPLYAVEDLNNFDAEELKRDINIMESERNKMKSNVNMNALLEYLKKDAAYKTRLGELEQITEERNAMRRHHEDLRRQRLEEFMSGFGVISLKLKEMYQMITLGGDAELELLDSLDPFSEGIVFSVRPPRKSWKNISNLSGGEKTLSSLALVFALHHYKPTPLYVMDEIDAALDFKNVSIVANYIKDRTKDAQFVIISLRNNMFELADRLVGIYKTHDATKSVTINPKKFENAVNGKNSTTSMMKNPPLADTTNTMSSLRA